MLIRPDLERFSELHVESPRSFGIPFGMNVEKLDEAGWGVIFHEDTSHDIRAALEPLIAARKKQAGVRAKVLDFKKGEQTRSWYQRHRMSAGNVDPEIVPYYLLLVGPPELIPYEFQYLLGVEYAVGRLAFDSAGEYEQYARSIIAYENDNAVPNSKEIFYWGTRHLGDPATNLSASLLIEPLANGIPDAAGALKRPIHADVGFNRTLRLADDAKKEALVAALRAKKPPAMLFTASHGMAVRSGQPKQRTDQGALLCQDWPSFGSVKPEHILTATDVADDAKVHGLVAFLFACYGAGTPDVDQFLMDLSDAGHAPPPAPQPFISALPKRLLAHPNGSALAVIGHIDRAWGFSEFSRPESPTRRSEPSAAASDMSSAGPRSAMPCAANWAQDLLRYRPRWRAPRPRSRLPVCGSAIATSSRIGSSATTRRTTSCWAIRPSVSARKSCSELKRRSAADHIHFGHRETSSDE